MALATFAAFAFSVTPRVHVDAVHVDAVHVAASRQSTVVAAGATTRRKNYTRFSLPGDGVAAVLAIGVCHRIVMQQ